MTSTEQIIQALGSAVASWQELREKRLFVDIAAADIVAAVTALHGMPGMRFVIVSGIDRRDGIEMLYHFSNDTSGAMISLRTVLADKQHPEIATVSTVLKGATWIEREIHELLGVVFTGHNILKHFLLPDDWPQGNYPLRQDTNGK